MTKANKIGNGNPKNKSFSIKNKLMIIFGGVIVISLSFFATVAIMTSRDLAMEKVAHHLKDKVIATSHIIDSALQKQIFHLSTLGRILLRDNSLNYVDKAILLSQEAKEVGISDIYICDNKGLSYFSDGETLFVGDREYFKSAMSGKTFISEPYRDRSTGKMCLTISLPVYDNDKIIGVIAADFLGFILNDYIKDIVVGEAGYCYIIGRSGSIIAHKNTKLVETKKNIVEVIKSNSSDKTVAEFIKDVMNTDEPSILFYEYRGINCISSFSKMASTGWTVITRAPIDEFMGTINNLQLLLIVIGLITLIIALIFIFILSGRIATPITKMAFALKDIEQGNLNTKIDYTANSKDEIGILAGSLSNMVEKLRSVVTEINQNAKNMTYVSNQINNTSQQLLQGSSEQVSSTQEVSSAMKQMQINISHNTDNAKITEKISIESQKGMLEVKENAEKSTHANNLINEKISIINDISDKTDILAINASIEASQAGKHGKGFAVVASEVRDLAELSKLVAEEIISLSANSKGLTDKTGKSLLSIIPNIEKTANLVKEITSASIEQNSGAEQINNAVQQLNQIAQQNSTTSEELAATSEEMTAQAEQLKNSVSYFKID